MRGSPNWDQGGDTSGPASAVDGHFASFDGVTGKVINDSGKSSSDFLAIADRPAAEVNANDIYDVGTCAGTSAWVGKVVSKAGSTVTISTTSGTEAALANQSGTCLAHMRLYNTTRGNYGLISQHNTGTHVCTLTATVPSDWVANDVLQITSVNNGSGYVDLEITAGPVGKSSIFMWGRFTGDTPGKALRVLPYAGLVGAAASLQLAICQVNAVPSGGFLLGIISNNLFSIGWDGNTTSILIREAGYL